MHLSHPYNVHFYLRHIPKGWYIIDSGFGRWSRSATPESKSTQTESSSQPGLVSRHMTTDNIHSIKSGVDSDKMALQICGSSATLDVSGTTAGKTSTLSSAADDNEM